MAVDIKLGPSSVELGTPRPVFASRLSTGPALFGARVYDVAPGARRFIALDVGETVSEPLTLVANWTADLKKK